VGARLLAKLDHMYLDAVLPPSYLSKVPGSAQSAEAIGFNALWASETMHDPFLTGALIAEHTHRISFGTAVAIAFARSPGNLAYLAWDLAQTSGGRFILGLGTQVKAHIERRFGMPWPESPVGKLREQIQAVRAIWQTWQTGVPLNFRGESYKLTLMSPFFNPGPIEHPNIPIYIAGVNTGLARLAGEIADGFQVHPFHSVPYLQEKLLPAIYQGVEKSGRIKSDIQIATTAMVVTNPQEREFTRSQIAFYASTPSYRAVLALHGWQETAENLSSLAARGQWGNMPALISDEMLAEFAVVSTPQDLAEALISRYRSIADRISLYRPFIPGEDDVFWKGLVDKFSD
jgi:probable F420-dependent oxidoreductase